MKSSFPIGLLGACGLVGFASCSADGAKLPSAQVTIKSAALDTGGQGSTFDPILDVCYGITVYNGVPNGDDTQTVWSNDDICSSRYGNDGGGDISYVGPCDASVTRDNYIVLTIGTVSTFGGPLLDQDTAGDLDPEFQNPCTVLHPCIQHFECKENKDVFVSFDLTLMRDADQGFFDIVVNFEDVFCSAKVDTCYDLTHPIELLQGEGSGRDHTAVIGVACTAGPDTGDALIDTEILFTSRTITCDDNVVFHLGGKDPIGVVTLPGPIYFRAATANGKRVIYEDYFGTEDLQCDGYSCNKTYYNTAIDIEDLANQDLKNCKLSFYATAHAAGAADGFDPATGKFSRAGGMYAAIHALAVPLIDGGYNTVCNAHPLDGADLYGGDSLVTSQYIGTLAQANPAFCYASTNGAALASLACAPPLCLPGCSECSGEVPELVCDVTTAGGVSTTHCHGTRSISDDGYGALRLWNVSDQGARLGGGVIGGGRFMQDTEPGYIAENGMIEFPPFSGSGVAGTPYSVTNEAGDLLLAASFLQCHQCDPGLVLAPTGECVSPQPDTACPDNCVTCEPFSDVTLVCTSGTLANTFQCELANGVPSSSYFLYSRAGDPIGNLVIASDSTSGIFGPYDGALGSNYYVSEIEGGSFIASTHDRCSSCLSPFTVDQHGLCVEESQTLP